MRKLVHSAFTWSAIAILSACTSVPRVPAAERDAMQVHPLGDTSFGLAFRCIKAALVAEGISIRVEDQESGRLVASLKKRETTSELWTAVRGDRRFREGERYEVEVTLQQVEGEAIEARASWLRYEHFSLGGKTTEEILEPSLYTYLFEKVDAELDRRKAAGRR